MQTWEENPWPAENFVDSPHGENGENLLPWATSAGMGGSTRHLHTPSGSPLSKSLKRTFEPGQAPLNLANRVAMRTKLRFEAGGGAEAEVVAVNFHLCKEDEFPGETKAESPHFLVTKKVSCPPRQSQLSEGPTQRSSGKLAVTSPTKPVPPHLHLHRQDGAPHQKDFGETSTIMSVAAASIPQRERAVVNKGPPRRTRTPSLVQTPGESAQVGKGKPEPDDDPENLAVLPPANSPYVLSGKDPVPARSWWQDAQNRGDRAGVTVWEERQTPTVVHDTNPSVSSGMYADRYSAGQRRSVESSVPAGIFVQPILLERHNEKEKELMREKERGAIVQGSTIPLEPTPLVPGRKESRLRAMLKEAKDRKTQQDSSTQKLTSEGLSITQRKRSPERSVSASPPTSPRRFNGKATLPKTRCAPTIENEEKIFWDSSPMNTPIASVSVSVLDESKKRQHEKGSRKQRASLAHQTDPFSLVKLEEDRKNYMQHPVKIAAIDEKAVVLRSAVATTVIQTNIPPNTILEGHSVIASAENTGEKELVVQNDVLRRPNTAQTSLKREVQKSTSSAREINTIASKPDQFSFISAGKAPIDDRRQGNEKTGSNDRDMPVRASEDKKEGTINGSRELVVMMRKEESPQRCQKGRIHVWSLNVPLWQGLQTISKACNQLLESMLCTSIYPIT